ncbi:ATP-binding cassette domain-containing protein [Mycoplasma miroungirhinis]|uniref:ATP-binding cassette domain-containing protein n=1 Tax=Mycoplasma miroungirhinis TaxID=754516 RepID=A0A6M4JE83_9MOLU|nr:ATP-binding cassette domain-containing protein [Mycoplasma miroungirhinis]QJR44386.1 ATP-binding cassette domain-containing protein [Mycoplasma miroungirhinis]
MINLKFQEVDIKYKTIDNPVLSNINFEIKEGEMVAFIGQSGVGKSTIFKSIVRSLKPANGQVLLNNENIYLQNKRKWKQTIQKIGFLTQQPNLIFSDNVYNNIVRSISQYKNKLYTIFSVLTRNQKRNIFEQLANLNILDKAFYRVSELSGGQQQRVEIAKLLTKKVELILADEPTSSLDFQTSLEVLDILKQLNKKYKLTIIVIIHDLNLVKKYFSRVIGFKNSTITLDKKTKEVKKWELLEAVSK